MYCRRVKSNTGFLSTQKIDEDLQGFGKLTGQFDLSCKVFSNLVGITKEHSLWLIYTIH